MEQETKKVNLKRLFITLGIVLVTTLAIGGSTYYVMSSNAKKEKEANDKQVAAMQKQIDDMQKTQEKKTNTTTATPAATTTKEPTADWKTYSDKTYGFSFKYPSETSVKPSASNNDTNYYTLLLNKTNTYISVSERSSGGSSVNINGLEAKYSSAETPMGYKYYAYEFNKLGKYIYLRFNDAPLNANQIMTLEKFKSMVGTFEFN